LVRISGHVTAEGLGSQIICSLLQHGQIWIAKRVDSCVDLPLDISLRERGFLGNTCHILTDNISDSDM
jgi:hypothetical protein